MNKDPLAFYKKTECIHWDCMSILAEWTAKSDLKGHCGVCKGNCMKESLHEIKLNVTEMRGNALNLRDTYQGSLAILFLDHGKLLE